MTTRALAIDHTDVNATISGVVLVPDARYVGNVLSRNAPAPGMNDPIDGSDTETDEAPKVIDFPLFKPIPSPRFASFAALVEWEGVVTKIKPTKFSASLRRLDRDDGLDVVAHFPIEELGDFERQNLRVGSVFRWAIGYARKPTGQKLRTSTIYFRRYTKPVAEGTRSATLEALIAGPAPRPDIA